MEDNQDHLNLLRKINKKPESSQRELAEELGFSLGKLNYCLQALKVKGLIKISNFKKNPKKINYIYVLTPKGISQKTKMPWHSMSDMKFFRETTVGRGKNVVIMGRKTWESLPIQPLPKRINIVVSNSWHDKLKDSRKWEYSDFYLRPCLEKACFFAHLRAESYTPKKEIYIIGGAMIYEEALKNNLVDKIVVSKVHGDYEGDVYFPELSEEWRSTVLGEYNGFKLLEYTK